MFTPLNLPQSNIKLKDDKIWCRLRKKYYKSTPEEWVRQNFINYLIDFKSYPEGRLVSEYPVEYNGMKKRCDIALFTQDYSVQLIVECKAPKVSITEDTFYQIARYNRTLGASILILTNGLNHYCAHVNLSAKELNYLKEIPNFEEVEKLAST
jgi:hypothetical protein